MDARQGFDHAELGVVRILVLVHQHVLEAQAVALADLRVLAEQLHALRDEIVEVECGACS